MAQLELLIAKKETKVHLLWPVISKQALSDTVREIKMAANIPSMKKLDEYARNHMQDDLGTKRIQQYLATLQERISRKRLQQTLGVVAFEGDEEEEDEKLVEKKKRVAVFKTEQPPSSPQKTTSSGRHVIKRICLA